MVDNPVHAFFCQPAGWTLIGELFRQPGEMLHTSDPGHAIVFMSLTEQEGTGVALFGLIGGSKKNEIRCKKGRGITYDIVGEGSHQPNLLALTGGRKHEHGVKQDISATLKPDPTNRYDPNAIAVFIRKKKVGYLSKKDAPIFGAFLKDAGADSAVCDGRIIGGWNTGDGDEGDFGVKLSLSWPPKRAS